MDKVVFESIKKQILSNRGTHCFETIHADKNDPNVFGGTLQKAIRDFLEDLHRGFHFSCPECGGILPELHFSYKHRYYNFVCTSITDGKGNVIAETDYKLLEKQCNALNTKTLPI